MKKFYPVILGICLLSGLAFPAQAQEDRARMVMEETRPEPKITFAENRVIIENLPDDGVLEVFNIMGGKIYSRRVNAGTNEYSIDLPKGYYIIRVGHLVKKVIIK